MNLQYMHLNLGMQGEIRKYKGFIVNLIYKIPYFCFPLFKPWCDGNSILVFLYKEKIIIIIKTKL